MSEAQKVMTVTFMRSDLYDAPSYTGACLTLPANQGEIQDAMDCARIMDGQPYKIVECFNDQGESLDFIPDNPPLAELNFLAQRIGGMEEHERLAFTGLVKIEKSLPDMKRLINLTYNLRDCHTLYGIGSDKALGKFYVENDMVGALLNVPDEVMKYIDYEKIGRTCREEEHGVFVGDCYVVGDITEFKEVYDGVLLPEQPEQPAYVFRLHIAEAPFDRWPDFENALEKEHCIPLLLPATDKEILIALEQLGTASLEECVFYRCECCILSLEQAFVFSEDIDKMNLLAKRIRELESSGELPKFKATFEASDCEDVDQALDLTKNLDCFDFFPELSSPEDYGRLEFMERYHVSGDDPDLKLIRFERYGPAMMERDGVQKTAYGLVRRNEKEMVLEYSQPHIEQQML